MGIVWIVPAAGLIAVIFAVFLARDVLRRDTGTDKMREIADMIFEGAMAFLKRQYQTIAILALVTAVLIGVLVGAFGNSGDTRSTGLTPGRRKTGYRHF